MSGIDRIKAERQRQIDVEGWTAEHDDEHDTGELAMAAACFAAPELIYTREEIVNGFGFIDPWPWFDEWDKRYGPTDEEELPDPARCSMVKRLDLLTKSGALIAAEIDRLERQEAWVCDQCEESFSIDHSTIEIDENHTVCSEECEQEWHANRS